MKKKLLIMIALMLVTAMSLSGCGFLDWLGSIFALPVELTDAPLNAETLIDFKEGADPDVLFESDGWSNGDVFNVVWKKHNVHYEDGIMRLGITEEKATAWLGEEEVEFNYTAGEARTQNYYHYGDYEVSMKPSANKGTASTFFVCTGPYDLKDGVPNAHDEIDIEFLGKDTTHVQFNFFVDGVGGNEYMYDLGFDASEEYHTYGFRWEPTAITWFVDGEPVYKVTTDASVETGENLKLVEKLPSTAGRILTNYWCGNERAYGWMGKYSGEGSDNGTTYQWIKTSAEGAPLNPPVVTPPVDGDDEIKWEEIEPMAPTFETTPEYVVAIDGNKANVTYTDVNGSAYKPIEMDITEAAKGKNYVRLSVTNNGAETVQVRVNVVDQALVDAGAQNMATNVSATMNGQPVFTDTSWGGSFFEIPAGETAELVVQFAGAVEKLQLMIDSSRNDSVLRSGDITVEGIKFAVVGEVELPHEHADADEDGKCDGCGEDMTVTPPPAPEHPTSGNLTLDFGDFQTAIGGNVTDGYGVNAEGNNISVEYTNIIGNSYKNIWAYVGDIAGNKTTFTMKVTNVGEAPIKLRVDIESQTQTSANTTCCNVSATMNGNPASTDTEWGGSMFVIEVGATVTIEVVYDASKLPTNVKFMIDSCQWDDSESHAGSIFITNMAFSGEYIPEEGGDDPDPKPEPVDPIVNVSDLELGTTSGEELIPGTGITASAGLTIDENKKSIDGFDFTKRLKLGGAMKVEEGVVKAGIKVEVSTRSRVIIYAISSSSSDSTRPFVLSRLNEDNMLVILSQTAGVDGASIAKYEIDIAEGGTYYIGSGKSGINIYYIAIEELPPVVEPEPEPDTGLQFEFWTSSDNYTANGHNIKYNGAGNAYSCAGTDITSLAAGKTTFTVTITNNGTAASRVRIDIQGENIVGNHKVLNTSATGGDVWTDAEWGGSSVTVEPGQSVTLVVEFDVNTERGKPVDLIVFVDAARGTADTYSSDITLSGMAFSGEAPAPEEPKPEEPKPEEPAVEGEYLSFTGNECYTLGATSDQYVNSIQVTYTAVSDNTYQNVNTWIQDKAAGKTTLGLTIKNNGAETVNITVKLESGSGAAETKVTLAAGEAKTIALEYAFAPDLLYFFIDSGWAEATATHAGDITISGINFK
jgi:endoglucanase